MANKHPHQLTQEDRMRGVAHRLQASTPERRALLGKIAAYSRWYEMARTDKERLECRIRYIAGIVGWCTANGERATALQGVMFISKLETEKRLLDREQPGTPTGPALEVGTTVDYDKLSNAQLESIVAQMTVDRRKPGHQTGAAAVGVARNNLEKWKEKQKEAAERAEERSTVEDADTE